MVLGSVSVKVLGFGIIVILFGFGPDESAKIGMKIFPM